MGKDLKTILSFLIGSLFLTAAQGQSTIPANGGNATGSGGTVSYTIGQVAYSTVSGTTGTITQGIQQPYEISVVTGTENANGISLECSVYPNPTTDFLILKIRDYDENNLSYWLYEVNGNLIESKEILTADTQISMRNQVSGIYFLKVKSGDKEVKTFKIIKN